VNVSDLTAPSTVPAGADIDALELAMPLLQQRKLLILTPFVVGAVAVASTFLVTPTFTAKTTFMPPQQQQSSAASALASLGALAGLAGSAGVRTPADQYVALMQSTVVSDRIIERFKLMSVYDSRFKDQTRQQLERNVRIGTGKKDGLISVEVDDTDPQRAAEIANRYVDELRRMTSELALTEAQQRRVFFEQQLKEAQSKLSQAQRTLESSGFTAGALRAEPRAAADIYARVRAEITTAEVRLEATRRSLADGTPEIQQQLATLSTLRGQLSDLERNQITAGAKGNSGYLEHYRDFKYQEKLFELFGQQFELAKVDESRDGALIQVVDPAEAPEHKSKPRRGVVGVSAALLSLLVLTLWLTGRHALRLTGQRDAAFQAKLDRLKAAWRG
jgi:uncharacterized protein involved in exopolysaccharide biosynthesis